MAELRENKASYLSTKLGSVNAAIATFCTAYDIRTVAYLQFEVKAICQSVSTPMEDVLGMFLGKSSEAPMEITRMMVTVKVKQGHRFFFVMLPHFLVTDF